jgi:hypothetical protein
MPRKAVCVPRSIFYFLTFSLVRESHLNPDSSTDCIVLEMHFTPPCPSFLSPKTGRAWAHALWGSCAAGVRQFRHSLAQHLVRPVHCTPGSAISLLVSGVYGTWPHVWLMSAACPFHVVSKWQEGLKKKKKFFDFKSCVPNHLSGQVRWLTPVILTTWEAEIGRLQFESRLGKIS